MRINILTNGTNGSIRSHVYISRYYQGHLDIKDAQCVKKMMGVKFYITSYRVWAPQAPSGAPKIQLFSKVAKFCRVDWN